MWHGRTELTEVPGRYKNAASVPRVLWHGRADLTEGPGTGMNVTELPCTGDVEDLIQLAFLLGQRPRGNP